MWAARRFCASAEITGPTSTDSRSGLPSRSSAIAPFSMVSDAVGDVVLQAEHAQRRAALAGRIEGRGQHVADDLLGQAPTNRRSCAFWPPVSAISGSAAGRRRLSRSASCRLIDCATSVEPVNTTPATAGLRDQAPADLAVAGQELQRLARHAGLVQERHGQRGDQRRLLGRLGDHRIAGGQRRRDLAGEDRQREVPRADAGDHAQRPMRVVRQSRRRSPRSSAGSRPLRAPRRWHCRSDLPASRTIGPSSGSSRASIRSAARRRRRGARRRRLLPRPGACAAGRIDQVGRRLDDRADDVAAIGRIGDRLRLARRAVRRPAAARRRSAAPACSVAASAASTCSLARSRPREFARARRTGRAAARCADAARRPAAAPAPARPDRRAASSSGTSGSAIRLTNEVLAPFSSRRRTR